MIHYGQKRIAGQAGQAGGPAHPGVPARARGRSLEGLQAGRILEIPRGVLPGHCPYRGRGAALAGVEGGQPAGGISVKPPYQRHTLSIT